MKKLLYLFLTVSLIFSSCKKEEDEPTVINGCMDSQATNYNANATNDDGSCAYDPVGVWEWESATQNGSDIMSDFSAVYSFFWDNGDFGLEYYVGSTLYRYTVGTCTLTGQSSVSMTDVGYTLDGGVWVEDATAETQSFNITKINSDELDLFDATNNITVNMGKSSRSLSEFK